MLWRIFFIFIIAMAVAGVVYLVTRFHRFSPLQRLAKEHRALSWLLAAVPVALLACFARINVTAMAVVLMHVMLIWLICDLAAWAIGRARGRRVNRDWQGIAALAIAALYLGAGWFFAHHIYRTDYALTTEKELGRETLRVVEIADSHLGITLDGRGFARLAERIQETQPDLVVVVGDFVDDDTDREDMLEACRALGGLDTTFGVYFAFGNHDRGYYDYRGFTAEELCAALAENGVTILEDASIPLGDDLYLIGRKDRSMRGRLDAAALTEGLDPSKYSILLDHQPNDYAGEAAAGVDLVLSGHTHGGHMFPAGLIGLAIGANDSVYGLQRRERTDFIVTSGVSGWAVPFKTGTISEFVVIDIARGA